MTRHPFAISKISSLELKELQKITSQTFFDAFLPFNSEENLKLYIEVAFNEKKLKQELLNTNSQWYFCKENSVTAGYLKINFAPAQTELQDETSLEIERIYSLKEYQRKGVGQVLMEKAMAIAKENNLQFIWLGVWEHNTKAIRFYERNGFQIFGTHSFKLGQEFQNDIMMRRYL